MPSRLLLCSVLLLPALAPAQRLPGNVTPVHYRLHLSPDIAKASFTGDETIDVVLQAPSKTITVNALELEIGSVRASGQAAVISFDPEKQQATFTFTQPLTAGPHALDIAFQGVLNDKLRGFYLSHAGSRNYAVTQFESTDARRAFPSFDEPALKATFDIALTIDRRDTAISNANVIADKAAGDGHHTLTFATTPRMSTYLVAFLVGDFACSKGKSEGVPIRVCSTPDQVKRTRFALEASRHFLHYYNTYFGIRYPMPKLDLIAIPDFEAGAMENFGAITYRETDLLVDEKVASINAQKRVASVVAHEMAHQWFGDMVTMQWWDNLWLNEGFATWMQDKAANDWHPEWNFPEDVAVSLDRTLNLDAGRTTRTIRAKAETPAEIEQMFDGISYGKAGAVIGMVEHWLGPQVFEQGVHNYLAAHLYGNATAEDFWNAQTANSHQPVDAVMASFVDRPGVPLLRFGDRQPAGFPVEQSRFYLAGATGDDRQAEDVGRGWTLPVCVKTAAGARCTVLGKDAAALESPATLPFFYADAGDKGYYRVLYTPGQVAAITAVAETGLTAPERLGFLGDRYALMRNGQVGVGEYLDLALALRQDPSASVLESSLSSLGFIRARIATEADRRLFDQVTLASYGPVYRALGAEGKNQTLDQKHLRAELFATLGEAGDPAVEAHARALSEDLLAGKRVLELDVIDAAVAITAQHGDEALSDRILAVHEHADDPGLKTEALDLLTAFEQPALVVRTLDYAVSGKVKNQDSANLIAAELHNSATQDVAWDWIGKHWDQVKAQLTIASGSRVVGATSGFCTVERRQEVAAFFSSHPVEASDRALSVALDAIDACVKLRAGQQPKLEDWLARHAVGTR